MFKVQDAPCTTCIYRKDSPLDLAKLEAQIKDSRGDFKNHRTCHHSKDVCCRGFYNVHKDSYWVTQIAQRLGMVLFVKEDDMT